jgi:hypothetical protein
MTDSNADDLVTVLETSDPAVLVVAKSVLDAAGIRYLARGEGVQDLFAWGRVGTGFNPFTGPVHLQVAAADAEQARELLEAANRDDRKGGREGDGA